ncbi:MAG: hypothetical protein JWQ90_2612 [Hydrocarboniphaga sp.]|nr:hypothetical protein [Hydrocarboniphaga sp.]
MGRPAKALISRESAARAALKLIDERGLDVLSLELIAKRLGVKAPSLYHHFHDKAEILAEVARLLLLDVRIPASTGDDWRDRAVEVSLRTRRSILAHPNAALLLLQFFPRYQLLGAYDYWAGQFSLPPDQRLTLIEGLEKLTFGSALFEASSMARGIEPMPAVDPVQLPDLAAAVKANQLSSEGMFVDSIRRLISGFTVEPAAGQSGAVEKIAGKRKIAATPGRAASTRASTGKSGTKRSGKTR